MLAGLSAIRRRHAAIVERTANQISGTRRVANPTTVQRAILSQRGPLAQRTSDLHLSYQSTTTCTTDQLNPSPRHRHRSTMVHPTLPAGCKSSPTRLFSSLHGKFPPTNQEIDQRR